MNNIQVGDLVMQPCRFEYGSRGVPICIRNEPYISVTSFVLTRLKQKEPCLVCSVINDDDGAVWLLVMNKNFVGWTSRVDDFIVVSRI